VERGGAILGTPPGTPKTPSPRRDRPRRRQKTRGNAHAPQRQRRTRSRRATAQKAEKIARTLGPTRDFTVHRQRKCQNSQYHATYRSDSLCVVTRVFPELNIQLRSHIQLWPCESGSDTLSLLDEKKLKNRAGQRAYRFGHAGQRALHLLHASRP
jgi:hypothetical protein